MSAPIRSHYQDSTPVHDEPLVCVFDDFISTREIRRLKAAAEDRLEPARVMEDSGSINRNGRTGSMCWIRKDHDDVISALAGRVSEVVGIALAHAEPFQLVHYGPAQSYAPHYDGWDAATEAGRRCMVRGGQRLVTCLLYLNDAPGSGTLFPRLRKTVEARRGRLLVFHNCAAGSTALHPDSLHGGLPVRAGEKWVCNLWFRERPL